MSVAIHAKQAFLARVSIDLRGRERDVTEELLYGEEIRAGFYQVRCEGVPQRVRGQASRTRCVLEASPHGRLYRPPRESSALRVHEEGGFGRSG